MRSRLVDDMARSAPCEGRRRRARRLWDDRDAPDRRDADAPRRMDEPRARPDGPERWTPAGFQQAVCSESGYPRSGIPANSGIAGTFTLK